MRGLIECAELRAPHRRFTVIEENINSVRAIAIDPMEGLLFWTDWHEE